MTDLYVTLAFVSMHDLSHLYHTFALLLCSLTNAACTIHTIRFVVTACKTYLSVYSTKVGVIFAFTQCNSVVREKLLLQITLCEHTFSKTVKTCMHGPKVRSK